MSVSKEMRIGDMDDGGGRLAALKRHAPLVLVLLAYSALALYNIGGKSLWIDETFSIRDALGFENISPIRPLYFLFLRFWLFFGDGPAYLRLPTVAFGALAIASLYRFVEGSYGKQAAVIACVMLAFSSSFIYFSQQIRYYTLIAAFGVVETMALVHYCRDATKTRLAAYWVFVLLGLLLSPTLALLNLSHPLFLMLAYRQDKPLVKKYIIGGIASMALYLPYGLYVFKTIVHWEQTSWIADSKVAGLFDALMAARVVGSTILTTPTEDPSAIYAGFAMAFVAVSLGVHYYITRKSESLLLLLSISVPVLVVLTASTFDFTFTHRKTIFFIAPLALAGAGVVTSSLPRMLWPLPLLPYLAVNILLLGNCYQQTSFQGENWKEAIRFMDNNLHQPDMTVIRIPGYISHVTDYYAERLYNYRDICGNLESEGGNDIEECKQRLDHVLKKLEGERFIVLIKIISNNSIPLRGYLNEKDLERTQYRFDNVLVLYFEEDASNPPMHCRDRECRFPAGDKFTLGDMRSLQKLFSDQPDRVVWSAGPGCGDQQGEWTASNLVSGKVPWDETRRRLGWWSLEGDTDCGGGSPWIQLEGPLDSGTFTTLHFRCNSLGGSHGIGVWEKVGCDLRIHAVSASDKE